MAFLSRLQSDICILSSEYGRKEVLCQDREDHLKVHVKSSLNKQILGVGDFVKSVLETGRGKRDMPVDSKFCTAAIQSTFIEPR